MAKSKSKSKSKSKKTGEKKTRSVITHKDVQLLYWRGQTSEIFTKQEQGKVSKSTLRKAAKTLADEGHPELLTEYERRFGAVGRGRSAITAGECRGFRVQQIKEQSKFIRLPLDSIEIAKKEVVYVVGVGENTPGVILTAAQRNDWIENGGSLADLARFFEGAEGDVSHSEDDAEDEDYSYDAEDDAADEAEDDAYAA